MNKSLSIIDILNFLTLRCSRDPEKNELFLCLVEMRCRY